MAILSQGSFNNWSGNFSLIFCSLLLYASALFHQDLFIFNYYYIIIHNTASDQLIELVYFPKISIFTAIFARGTTSVSKALMISTFLLSFFITQTSKPRTICNLLVVKEISLRIFAHLVRTCSTCQGAMGYEW